MIRKTDNIREIIEALHLKDEEIIAKGHRIWLNNYAMAVK